ncbi:YbcC family protein [Pontivivens insulae]|uniref:Probable inorganic carbon transporter subunit DabA n=1 Tax=Pontivivens insulae TaxID=1639689 RepID=A0A2R8A6M5_9RHOB|nr:DUF2309 domain-containing protein [Pontivivens insulae]RED17994.1 hypothetical protein DFR53_0182 [Pontivivens insulae]SPF27884.1 hypothetical protein POI8812_00179 [Pontivivens insulae]
MTTTLMSAATTAANAIPPAWPLAATVAVNPWLGQSAESFPTAAARMRRVGGFSSTPTRDWFAQAHAAGKITDADVGAAAAAAGLSPQQMFEALQTPRSDGDGLPLVTELAAAESKIDWPAVVIERIGMWAASWFDHGQALWPTARGRSAYDAWRRYAMRDLTPEILGLSGFTDFVTNQPEEAEAALAKAVETLGLTEAALETAFHTVLHALGGWGQAARWQLWQAELQGGADTVATDLLTIRLVWEAALLEHYRDQIGADWADAAEAHAQPVEPAVDDRIDAAWQDAADRAHQRGVAEKLTGGRSSSQDTRAKVQAAFCIDVRSEVFRRAFESLDPAIDTIGFAGFFGVPLTHRAQGSIAPDPHLPVLLNAGMTSEATVNDELEQATRISARAKRALGRFRMAAVSSFAWVEAAGPLYLKKLVADALGHEHGPKEAAATPQLLDVSIDNRIALAAGALKGMSLTDDFAPVVLLVGHGAHVTNNPMASALQCGACGGQNGEANARVLAGVLNTPEVRAGLVEQGITIPDDTLFIGALHDTTADEVRLFDVPASADLKLVRKWLKEAGALARAERAQLIPGADGTTLKQRAHDWAEVRPEWGLAGCAAFVAAPRHRTADADLGGRSFLHSYDWKKDEGFGVLELILTAPVVVASWISLQYYGSTVAPDTFGAGNKLLHNVVGGFGVLEGNGGAPRTGLALQSVHDGEVFRHDPLRLSVIVEAPADAITDILAKHQGVRDLFDNGWLHLLRLDESGRVADRYVGGLNWEPFDGSTPVLEAA